MIVRAATSDDFAAMADIHARAFARGWDRDAIGALMEGLGVFALLAEDEEPRAFILIRVAADEAEVLTLAVRPDMRRKGLASRLLANSAVRAAENGATRLFLEVAAANVPARNLYGKFGFGEVGLRKAYYDNGDDALTLSANLPLALRMGNSAKTL